MAPARDDLAAVFVGVATLDAIALVACYPGADERVLADEVAYAGGGPAATSAVAAARLGVPCAFVGAVGDDANGHAIIAGLEAEGVDVSGVTLLPGEASAASVVVVDRGRGTRAISNRPAPRVEIAAGADLIATAPVVHVDHAGWAPVHASGLVRAGQLLSVDAGNDIPHFDTRSAGLYVPTVEALQRLHGGLEVDALLARAVADGAGTVVATAGSRGSWALTAQGERAHAPAHRVDVLSTLGAGDVFHGALVAAVVDGLPLHDQLVVANLTAALSCRGLDGRSAIPRAASASALLATISHPAPDVTPDPVPAPSSTNPA